MERWLVVERCRSLPRGFAIAVVAIVTVVTVIAVVAIVASGKLEKAMPDRRNNPV